MKNKITMTAKVDSDVKNEVCQLLSQYRSRNKRLYSSLSCYAKFVEEQQYVKVTNRLFSSVRDICDSLNDSISGINQALQNTCLPQSDDQKRKIFPWYDAVLSWAHDSRAFIQNIYPIVRDDNNLYVNSDDLHSLIALQSALNTIEYSTRVAMQGEDDGELMVCEIFKVFDKFKRCYRESEKAFIKDKESAFYGSVSCAKGFEAVPLNLYGNAFKYLPPNVPKERCINVSFKENVVGVVISVASVGPYVPPEDVPNLWNPGVRADSAILATDDGYGLGLPRVKKLCELSGFTPTITSVHRKEDSDGWGLFTVAIQVPRCTYKDMGG